MKILDLMLAESELQDIKKEILELYKTYKDQNSKIIVELAGNPAVKDITGDLDQVFDQAKARFAAAQRALALANKLGDPAQKSRVWGNLNMLRAFVKNLTNQIEQRYEQMLSQARGTASGAVTADTRNGTYGGDANQQTSQQPQQRNATGVPPRFGQQQQQQPTQ